MYANGHLIGQIGDFPPHARITFASNEMFLIPRSLIPSGQPLVLAVRVLRSPLLAMISAGGFNGTPAVGDAAAVARWRDLQIHDAFWSLAGGEILLTVSILAAMLGLEGRGGSSRLHPEYQG